jgi:hypothetical protein
VVGERLFHDVRRDTAHHAIAQVDQEGVKFDQRRRVGDRVGCHQKHVEPIVRCTHMYVIDTAREVERRVEQAVVEVGGAYAFGREPCHRCHVGSRLLDEMPGQDDGA